MNFTNLKTSGQVRLSDQVPENTAPQGTVSTEGVDNAIERVRQAISLNDKEKELKESLEKVGNLIMNIENLTSCIDTTDRNIMSWLPMLNEIIIKVKNLPNIIDAACLRLERTTISISPSDVFLKFTDKYYDDLKKLNTENLDKLMEKQNEHIALLTASGDEYAKRLAIIRNKHVNELRTQMRTNGVWLSTRSFAMLLVPVVVCAAFGVIAFIKWLS